ncbi:uncharacterized protein LOC116800412 [Drosophila sechellia]|uniref:uncharacterized protein LOC116800412 n=1 Tax=Drosophila sechellia TaxID=7238 RepID=UPI0013DDBCBE|nr:uncharacterized protein LOC116800412 [Drosophila sechellia]
MWNSSWLWSSFSVSSCRRSSIWILRVAGRMDFAAPRWVPWSKRRQLLWPVFCSAALQVDCIGDEGYCQGPCGEKVQDQLECVVLGLFIRVR